MANLCVFRIFFFHSDSSHFSKFIFAITNQSLSTFQNLGKGSLWMVDAQYRSNLIQALSRSPFPPPTATNISTPEKIARKVVNSRLPDPVLFPYLSKRLASSNIGENSETEFDSDVDAAAAAMLSFKHGPIILNHNKGIVVLSVALFPMLGIIAFYLLF